MKNLISSQTGLTILEVVISLLLVSVSVVGLHMTYLRAVDVHQNGLNTVKILLASDSYFEKAMIIGTAPAYYSPTAYPISRQSWSVPETYVNCYTQTCSNNVFLDFAKITVDRSLADDNIVMYSFAPSGANQLKYNIFVWNMNLPGGRVNILPSPVLDCLNTYLNSSTASLQKSNPDLYLNNWKPKNCLILAR